MIRRDTSSEPHIIDVLLQTPLYTARGVDIIQIGINQYLEHLPWMKIAVSSTPITAQYRIYIQQFDNCIDHSH